jgi:hypothetical protein
VRSTTFLFTTLCTSIQNFRDFRVWIGLPWNIFKPPEAAPRRRARRAARAPRRLGICVARHPRPRLPQDVHVLRCLVLRGIPYALHLARRSVRRFLLCAHSYQGSPPYEALTPRASFTARPRGRATPPHRLFKGGTLPRACTPRTSLAPPSPSRAPTSSRGRATVPVPPLAPAGVDRAARSRAPAGSSPEQGVPWLAAAAAAVRLRQRHHRPNL